MKTGIIQNIFYVAKVYLKLRFKFWLRAWSDKYKTNKALLIVTLKCCATNTMFFGKR